jgi:hypothetical protein
LKTQGQLFGYRLACTLVQECPLILFGLLGGLLLLIVVAMVSSIAPTGGGSGRRSS